METSLGQHVDIGDVEIRKVVGVQIRQAHIHRVVGFLHSQLFRDILKASSLQILQQCISPEVVGDHQVLIAIPVEIRMAYRLAPAGIGSPTLSDLFEAHAAHVAKQDVRIRVDVVLRQRG